MQVLHRLLPGFAAVDHNTVSVALQIQLPNHRDNPQKETLRFAGFPFVQLLESVYSPLRDYQYMDWCLRIDIMKGQYIIILVDDIRRSLPGEDFIENRPLIFPIHLLALRGTVQR